MPRVGPSIGGKGVDIFFPIARMSVSGLTILGLGGLVGLLSGEEAGLYVSALINNYSKNGLYAVREKAVQLFRLY